jgi:DNA-binding MarR family transcriptional regulator
MAGSTQGILFKLYDPHTPPVRSDDPPTSQVAAMHVLETINQRQAFALAAVREHPGKTAAEIEAAIQCRDGRVRKRLKELVRGGLVTELAPRVCEVTGYKATCYRVREVSS